MDAPLPVEDAVRVTVEDTTALFAGETHTRLGGGGSACILNDDGLFRIPLFVNVIWLVPVVGR
jgi:hypothetical protein